MGEERGDSDAGIDVQWSRDVGRAQWIGDRLAPFGQNMTSVIPGGFEAYARLLHPVETEPRGIRATVRWADVARWSGLPLTRDAQFQDIALPADTPAGPAPGAGSRPADGTLCRDDAAALIDLLRAATASPGDRRCWFALWAGYGWEGGGALLTFGGAATETSKLPAPIPAEVRSGTKVELPDRSYLLYSGDLSAALAWLPTEQQTPNLWWPDDQSWCVASEIDLPWTYVGGPRSLIDRIVADRRLEALPAAPDDPIQLRARGHVERLIDEITAELFATGAAERVTPRGTITAQLTLPRLLRKGTLEISVAGEHGSQSGGAYLGTRDPAELRARVRATLEWSICRDLAGM